MREKKKILLLMFLKAIPLKNIHLEISLTVAAAKNFISDTLPYTPLANPEFLLPVLDSCIVANIFYSDSLTP